MLQLRSLYKSYGSKLALDIADLSPNQKTPVSLRQSPTRYRRLIAWADAEPLTTLDLAGRKALNHLIADHQARNDASFIISSRQEIGQAMLPAAHNLTLIEGRIVL
jgi:ABC-type transport system involved in cytochrome c biogenesis ATPase subunit